ASSGYLGTVRLRRRPSAPRSRRLHAAWKDAADGGPEGRLPGVHRRGDDVVDLPGGYFYPANDVGSGKGAVSLNGHCGGWMSRRVFGSSTIANSGSSSLLFCFEPLLL